MKIARVFPTKTSMSPIDLDSYFGPPGLFTLLGYKEIHISVAFTWDLEKAMWLKKQWQMIAPVKVGGPAIDGEPMNGFVPGKYLKKGITITSRGCPFRCPWCLVKRNLIEINDFPEGNIIQDNNLLACSRSHVDKVFQMLSHQRAIKFSGGLDPRLILDKTVEKLRGLSISQLWLSYDHPEAIKPLKEVIGKLKKYFSRNQIRCYVLIGFHGDTLEKAESRLRVVFEMGALPFAMRYRLPKNNWRDSFISNQREWNLLTRNWTRPAIMKARMKDR